MKIKVIVWQEADVWCATLLYRVVIPMEKVMII